MAAPTVADYLLERLRGWGVDKVFAFPGDGINGILAAWGRADNQPKFVQSRHEEMSAFEAVGYAKFTGRVGVRSAPAVQARCRASDAGTRSGDDHCLRHSLCTLLGSVG
jgi:hypothetical protein